MCIRNICLKIKNNNIKVISWTVAQAISFLKSVWRPNPNVATTRLAKIQIVRRKKLLTSWNTERKINKQNSADLTKNPLRKIENAVGDSTWTLSNQ